MKEYLKQHKIMHEGKKTFAGNTLFVYSKPLKEILSFFKPDSLLDYGCGKGAQYTSRKAHEEFNCPMPTLYDPCYEPFERKPTGTFAGVICVDVLEHVPEEDLDNIIKDIFAYTESFVFIGISIKLAKKSLPNGKNCHATVKPPNWWKEKVLQHKPHNIKTFLYYGISKTKCGLIYRDETEREK